MIQTLTEKLLAIFNTMKGNDNTTPFSQVFDYLSEGGESYPFLAFEIDKMEASILDTTNNTRDYYFIVAIHQEITKSGGRAEAVRIVSDAVDLVINTLDKNYTLDGLAEGGCAPV